MFNDVSKDDGKLECIESETGNIANADDESGCIGGIKTETDVELNNNNNNVPEQQKDKYDFDFLYVQKVQICTFLHVLLSIWVPTALLDHV